MIIMCYAVLGGKLLENVELGFPASCLHDFKMYLFSIKLLKSAENTKTRVSQLPQQCCEDSWVKDLEAQVLFDLVSTDSPFWRHRVHSTPNCVFFECVGGGEARGVAGSWSRLSRGRGSGSSALLSVVLSEGERAGGQFPRVSCRGVMDLTRRTWSDHAAAAGQLIYWSARVA